MRLRSLCLRPFAGVSDRTIPFAPGLNVIVGPNESGKSTLVSALDCCLFQGVDPGTKVWRTLQRHVPLPSGDYFRVVLEFEIAGQDYRLTKTWSESKPLRGCELRMPGGQVLADSNQVNAVLDSLVGWKPGTWRNVLCADQAALPSTLESIKLDSETRNEVTRRLRKAFLETDGVSLERLETRLREKVERCYAHWDTMQCRPEGNRDLQNRWSRDVGTVLEAWYSMRAAEVVWEKARVFEQERDGWLLKKEQLLAELDAIEAFRKEWGPLLEQAEKRTALEQTLSTASKERDALEKAYRHWPTCTEDAERMKASLAEQQTLLQSLESELKRATEWARLAAQRHQLKTALEIHTQLQKNAAALKGVKQVTAQEQWVLEDALRRKQLIETKLGAGKLQLTLEALRETEVAHQSDLGARTEQILTPGVPLQLEAGGRILLEHPDWKLTIKSGETSFDQLQSQHQEIQDEIQRVLEQSGVGTPEELKLFAQEFANAEKAVDDCRKDLAKVLNGTTLEELVPLVGSSQDSTPPREIAAITNEKLAKGKALHDTEVGLKDVELQLSVWARDYQTVDQVLNRLAPLHLQVQKLADELGGLSVSADSVADLEQRRIELLNSDARLRHIKEVELPETKVELARIQGDEPEASVAELVEQLAAARLAFEEAQKRAQAYQTILDVFKGLKDSLDQNPLDPLLADVQRLLHQLTGDRFENIELEGGTFRRHGSVDMSTQLLSVGMNAGFGLAVRLAMAAHFLSGQDGLLVLDDPFVDVDPVRQKAAAEMINSFALDKQVLVLTCHPSQAELFGVTPIELGPLK
ncbi:MAG: AAA family ATPase [Planctomycetaceae bacterium]|nr:AAA family ATPase [Planctomycetaceae bacterium]